MRNHAVRRPHQYCYRFKLVMILGIGAIALASCGPSKKDECVQILDTIETSRQQQILGTQTQDTMRQNATLTEKLADQLDAMSLNNKKLQEYTKILVKGYRAEVAAEKAYADMANAEGIVSVRSGDGEKQKALDDIQSQRRKAANQVQLGFGQIGSFCAI